MILRGRSAGLRSRVTLRATVSRRILLPLAFFLATFSLAIYVTGGFVASPLGLRVSARSPMPSAIAALAAMAAWMIVAARAGAIRDDLLHAEVWLSAHASVRIATIAGLAGAIAIRYGSYSAAGSDASGYLSQAVMLGSGELMRAEPLTAVANWPDAAATLAPLGWRAAMEPGLQVPTYAVGLPLLMTPLHAVGGLSAAALVAAASLAVAVWATGRVALQVAGPPAAAIAAVWLATSPVALIQSMQPMSDMPVTAAWLVCWLLVLPNATVSPLPRSAAAGIAAGLAILIRPNLAPLAAIPALWLMRRSTCSVAAFSVPVALAGVTVGYLQWRYFGSPWRSGYGTAGEIYAMSNVAPNAALYTRWLLETQGLVLLLAPLAAVWPSSPGRRTMRWLLGFAALVILPYLFYAVFEVWTYLRFLLPAIAIAMVAVAALASAWIARVPRPWRPPILATILLALAAMNIAAARSHGVFRFAAGQSRAALAGRYLDSLIPEKSVLIAGEQSGAMRYHTGRSIVRWDVLSPEALERVNAQLSASDYDIWIALDAWEEELFRVRFPGTAAAALDWPPRLEAGGALLTRAWRLRDREPFMRGERITTDRLR